MTKQKPKNRKSEKREKKNYNCDNKNKIRQLIVDEGFYIEDKDMKLKRWSKEIKELESQEKQKNERNK